MLQESIKLNAETCGLPIAARNQLKPEFVFWQDLLVELLVELLLRSLYSFNIYGPNTSNSATEMNAAAPPGTP